jgi:hypothetical protein
MRFEIEVELEGKSYEYVVAFEYPSGFKELRVLEEKVVVNGNPVYSRQIAQVQLAKEYHEKEVKFLIDWHLVALPIVQAQMNDPLFVFKQWLARMLVLRPIPGLILGHSNQETLHPKPEVTDFGAWFSGLLAYAPAAYTQIDAYLKQVMPDLKDIKNPVIGKDSRSLVIQFSNNQASLSLAFDGTPNYFPLATSASHCSHDVYWRPSAGFDTMKSYDSPDYGSLSRFPGHWLN